MLYRNVEVSETLNRTAQRRRSASPAARRQIGAVLARSKSAASVTYFLQAHPRAVQQVISLEGKTVQVWTQGAIVRAWPIAPPGYFADCYTPEEIEEENRIMAHLYPRKSKGLPE